MLGGEWARTRTQRHRDESEDAVAAGNGKRGVTQIATKMWFESGGMRGLRRGTVVVWMKSLKEGECERDP
jgi:hypothetical protein